MQSESDAVRAIYREGDTIRHINVVEDKGEGITIERHFTDDDGLNVWDRITTDDRKACITDGAGNIKFEQPVKHIPEFWSQTAVNIVASKYFRGTIGAPDRENSIFQLTSRVVDTITNWGVDGGYFKTQDDSLRFREELEHLLVHQMYSFNSPVWFNVGVEGEEYPQCSACFINKVTDDMESIMALAATEARLFKGGSGAGVNLSPLRSSKEGLSGGGKASGPVSFMRGYDSFAGVIKSGGKTRRAAKIVILDCDHPDIMEFITCKAHEEKKAWALINSGYDGDFRGEAYSTIGFQNANHSVRVSDEFMIAAMHGSDWDLKAVKGKDILDSVNAKDVLMEIANCTHVCGDPGIQYDTTINNWHTCKNSDKIHASNPCSEFMFLNESACNLGSLNLSSFIKYNGEFDVSGFRHACRIAILAQEIIVDYSSYPTHEIAKNSHNFRPLGLGFANLGSMLMRMGIPYDSEIGRAYASAITALMTGEAYSMSAFIANDRGPFPMYHGDHNEKSMMEVIGMHRDAAYQRCQVRIQQDLLDASKEVWDTAISLGEKYGFRNAQVSLLAPTGTIAFMMDCDTTGIEPDIALIKYKRLVGGGTLKIVNQAVKPALEKLGYTQNEAKDIIQFIDEHETIEGSPLRDEDLPVFDCALRPKCGVRFISPMGHLKMMAACQPFLSGAISKTVNVPENSTAEEIYDLYMEAWKMGLKAVAIYRDNSKRSQPMSMGEEQNDKPVKLERKKLPKDRDAKTHKFNIGGHEGFLIVGLYPDNTPGEIFITMSKQGSTISGLMDTIAIQTSMLLQYGVPLEVIVRRFSHMRFEPSGFTGSKEVPVAKSIVDYIFRFLAAKYLDSGEMTTHEPETEENMRADAPPCPECGAITQRSGTCYTCTGCGTTTGCG